MPALDRVNERDLETTISMGTQKGNLLSNGSKLAMGKQESLLDEQASPCDYAAIFRANPSDSSAVALRALPFRQRQFSAPPLLLANGKRETEKFKYLLTS